MSSIIRTLALIMWTAAALAWGSLLVALAFRAGWILAEVLS